MLPFTGAHRLCRLKSPHTRWLGLFTEPTPCNSLVLVVFLLLLAREKVHSIAFSSHLSHHRNMRKRCSALFIWPRLRFEGRMFLVTEQPSLAFFGPPGIPKRQGNIPFWFDQRGGQDLVWIKSALTWFACSRNRLALVNKHDRQSWMFRLACIAASKGR